MDAVTSTVISTAETLAPALIAAAAVSSPQAASIVALAPIAVQLMQSAIQLQSAGAMTPEQLAALFASIGAGVQATHVSWAALNVAPA